MASATQRIINLGERLWGLLTRILPPRLLDRIGISAAKGLFLYADLALAEAEAREGLPIPPAPLRYRVWGDPDISTFLWSGSHCRQDIDRELRRLGLEWSSTGRILDFGCGCGRIFRHLPESVRSRCVGTDTDQEAIEWCIDHFPDATFLLNNALPPLDHPDGSFDLVLAIAVFRHLGEEMQFRWLAEMKRLLKPGGILLASLHGEFCWRHFPPREVAKLETDGFLHKPLRDPYQRQVFLAWYQATYHSREYAVRNYARFFDIVDYIPRGIEQETDLIVCRRAD